MHEWGDEFFQQYGPELNKAMDYIRDYVYYRSNYWVMMKEKYGTIRYEFLYPQPYVYRSKWDKNKIIQCIRYYKFRLAMWLLDRAIKKACKKFPHIREEILWDREGWN